jgi:hypothetical protein
MRVRPEAVELGRERALAGRFGLLERLGNDFECLVE